MEPPAAVDEEATQAASAGRSSGYAAVPCDELSAAPAWIQRLPRPSRYALVFPFSAALLVAALLALENSGSRTPSTTASLESNAVSLFQAGAFTCAAFGCLDVRSANACGCSHHCVEDGNCCADYRAVCTPAAVKARLGTWTGCHPPGPLVPPAGGWGYVPRGPALQVKVLSYNPEWWHVIEQLGGNGNSAAKVIMGASQPVPFDFIGFQEFYDPWFGLTRPGFDGSWLLQHYTFLRGEVGGPVGTLIGFRNETWALLARGQRFVAEDKKGPTYFGKRIALWARLQHKQTGKTVFFMNHHGPLPTNTGGVCGPMATAANLLHIVAENARLGDAVVFVGDFNANEASVTIKQLSARLHKCFVGIDHIFTNLPPAAVLHQARLPSGGSDHAAIAAVLQLPGDTPAQPAVVPPPSGPPAAAALAEQTAQAA